MSDGLAICRPQPACPPLLSPYPHRANFCYDIWVEVVVLQDLCIVQEEVWRHVDDKPRMLADVIRCCPLERVDVQHASNEPRSITRQVLWHCIHARFDFAKERGDEIVVKWELSAQKYVENHTAAPVGRRRLGMGGVRDWEDGGWGKGKERGEDALCGQRTTRRPPGRRKGWVRVRQGQIGERPRIQKDGSAQETQDVLSRDNLR